MTTTTIRIDDDLKARLTAVAERAGKTSHAFIVDAVAQSVADAESDEELDRVAEQRWAKMLVTGKTVDWTDARSYVEARVRGSQAVKPIARKPKP